MKRCSKLFLFALLMSLFAAPACWAVSVKGADGSELGLGQIGDIIRHVRGFVSGDLGLEKESLLIVRERGGTLDSSVYRFDTKGKATVAGGKTSKASDPNPHLIGNRDYLQGLPIVALPLDTSWKNKTAMQALVTLPYVSSNGQKTGHYLSIDQNRDASGVVSVTAGDSRGDSLLDCLGINPVFLDSMPIVEVKNGVTVKSCDVELSAVLMRSREAVSVYFVRLDVSSGAAAVKAVTDSVGRPLSWFAYIDSNALPTMSNGDTPLFPVSMAVGDFDNDGYKNEIALAWSDIDHVNLRVLQLSPDGSQFSVGEMKGSDGISIVHNYKYDNIRLGRNIGKKLDGVTSVYSTSVVAGDFNGDHQDEFAVVFRDNAPSIINNDYIQNKSIYYYGDFVYDEGELVGTPVIFDGLTGKIHVVTHQWDARTGTFQTTENDPKDYSAYDGGYYAIPLAVKATAADVNGDGRDDVATVTMVVTFGLGPDNNESLNWSQFQYFRVDSHIDVWSYAPKSIAPKHSFSYPIVGVRGCSYPNGGDDAGASYIYIPGNTWITDKATTLCEPIRAMLLKDGSVYPYMEHEFDITAGNFTGRIADVITAEDLVIKCPYLAWKPDLPEFEWGGEEEEYKFYVSEREKTVVGLLHNITLSDTDNEEWGDGTRGTCDKQQIGDPFTRDYAVGLVPGNYLDEGVKLGAPIKITDTKDLDYIAILQMVPYHVDNVSSDGTVTVNPYNFTLNDGTNVTYSNTSGSVSENNLSYNMTKSTETIFSLNCSAVSDTAKMFQGVRGVSTALFGDTDNEVAQGIEEAGKIWDKLKDTVDKTTTTANDNKAVYAMSMTTQADRLDTLFMDTSTRYLWRYPVLTYPVPDWLIGQVKDETMEDPDKTQLRDQQTYVTFAMSEPCTHAGALGVNDSHYQPYHEPGNLFSYPSSIEQTEGYDPNTSQYLVSGNTFQWGGQTISQTLTFEGATISQDKTKKVNKTGAITNFLSAIDTLFGSDLAQIPQNSDSTFTRSVTKNESLSVNITAPDSGAGFEMLYSPYLDTAGTTTVAFAVKGFGEDSIWTKCLYSKMPDPSLLLPGKFGYKSGKFVVNTDDSTALKMRGLRFYLADYSDMPTDYSPLVKGLAYKIRVPVYNASFVDADSFKVHLSYAASNAYNAKRTPVGEYTFGGTNPPLYGWGSKAGDSRQFAEFVWSPDANITDGTYYLFVDIDSGDKLPEIHENRRDKDGNLIDCGGNNMGYFKVGIVAPDSKFLNWSEDDTEVSVASEPGINGTRANGLDVDDFIAEKVLGADGPVPVELEVDYSGKYIIPDVEMVAYKLRPEAKKKATSELVDGDIEMYFLREEFDLFPGGEHKIAFHMDPRYLEDGPECVRFAVNVAGAEYPVTDLVREDGGSSGSGGGSGGGCSAGFGALAAAALCGAAFFIRKRR